MDKSLSHNTRTLMYMRWNYFARHQGEQLPVRFLQSTRGGYFESVDKALRDIRLIDEISIETLTQRGAPFNAVPTVPSGFPSVGYLTEFEVTTASSRHWPEDLSSFGPEVASAIEECHGWLHAAADRGAGLVAFCY